MAKYTDEQGKIHFVEKILAKDAQGTLYTTKNPTILLCDAKDRLLDKELYENARYMPLAGIKKLILPTYYLEDPDIGYVLEVPAGYAPLESSLNSTEDTIFPIENPLKILRQIADILGRLHDLPAIYGPLSTARILVKNDEVLMLYSVGLSYVVNFSISEGLATYEDPYAKNIGGPTVLSDVYAFALLAKDVLQQARGHKNEHVSKELQELIEKALSPDIYVRPQIIELYEALCIASPELSIYRKKYKNKFYKQEHITPIYNTTTKNTQKSNMLHCL